MQNYFEANPAPWLAAEFDYFQIPRPRWELLLLRLKQMGATMVTLAVPWRFHELESGLVDFTGITTDRRDLLGTLRLCHELELVCFLNLGPYLGSGVLNDGLPEWLPDEVGDGFLQATQQWYQRLSKALVAEQWPQGPIVALQVDNGATSGLAPSLDSRLTEVKWPIWLRKRYADIAELNAVYGTDYRTVSRVDFPASWAEGSTPLDQDARLFLEEMETTVQTKFSEMLQAAGWQIPIEGFDEDVTSGVPDVTSRLLTPSAKVDSIPTEAIFQVGWPIQIDPAPAEISPAPTVANLAPIRADGSIRRRFLMVRHTLWSQTLSEGKLTDEQFVVAGDHNLWLSASADAALKLNTTLPTKTTVYRLKFDGELTPWPGLQVARKKVSGPYRVEDQFGQTDLAIVTPEATVPLTGFLATYLRDYQLSQTQAVRRSLDLTKTLVEALTLGVDEETIPSDEGQPKASSYILDEARRGLRQADSALQKALSSIGGLEAGFATMLNNDDPEEAQPALAPLTINPAAFEGAAQQTLIEIGQRLAEVVPTLQDVLAHLQARLDQAEGLSLAQYQESYQFVGETTNSAQGKLQMLIAHLRRDLTAARLPLVAWRVHDQVQAIEQTLHWGVLRGKNYGY